MPRGVCKWFNNKKGFGFISQDDGNDVFVHYTGIQGEGFRTLNEGDQVEFEIEDSDKGPRAVSVKVV
jgi:CspA family cold shock protein